MGNDTIKINGVIKEVLNGTTFRVLLQNGILIIANPSGKMRIHHIQLLPGDNVELELSPYDLTKGRITKRF
jgi:translation initiation factor IF-1